MKISRIRHVIITSIIFLIIIAIIVAVNSSTIKMLRENNTELYYRVVANQEIDQGKEITSDMVTTIQMAKIDMQENAVYRKYRDDKVLESVEKTETLSNAWKEYEELYADKVDAGEMLESDAVKLVNEKYNVNIIAEPDELWVVGKRAKEKIYKGEIILADKVVYSEDMPAEETRLYAIPFDSSTTGGYNISLGEKVDICVLYSDSEKTISEYQTLPANKAIDIVLAGKTIADIRDESGNSRKNEQTVSVVPGYICFNLTYEEINKIEIAKRQGTLFIGSPENYYKEDSQAATFMAGVQMPNF